jgi:hypothetical protein
MTRFYPVYPRRSDGKLEVDTKRGKEKNEPSVDQLDKTPNSKGVCDYYREIPEDEPKHIDWRKKLAGMLIRELAVDKADEGKDSLSGLEFPVKLLSN